MDKDNWISPERVAQMIDSGMRVERERCAKIIEEETQWSSSMVVDRHVKAILKKIREGNGG